jgi:CAAX protease family protein
MKGQTTLQKIIYFPLTRMIIGIAAVVASVAFCEWARKLFSDKFQLANDLEDAIIGIAEIGMALLSYIILFRVYEKRQIRELNAAAFSNNALIAFSSGIVLQSFTILVIYLVGGYQILHVNPFSFLIPGLIQAAVAGFVAEILFVGIVFRLAEEKLGTVIALIITSLFFVIMHSGARGATILSVASTAIQAGILLPALYVFSRSLWPPIFFHFAWDFAEPAIYGGVNPGIGIGKSLFISKFTGSDLLTGGQFGPGNSIQASLVCTIAAFLFLWSAKQKNNFMQAYWKK